MAVSFMYYLRQACAISMICASKSQLVTLWLS
jgi:hypothetical protein